MLSIEPHKGEFARNGRRLGQAGAIIAATFALALTGCQEGSGQRAQADASNAADQAGVALNAAAADTKATVDDLAAGAKPGMDRAAKDAKQGLDKLAVAAGRATVHAGATLEHAGERARVRVRDNTADENQGE